MSYITLGIPMIDSLLPDGMPRNSFILLFGEGGTGKSVALAQAAGNRIRLGEPCMFVTFDDSPSSIINNFLRLGYEVRGALANNILRIVDCFSFRARILPKPTDGIRVVQNPKDHHELTGTLLSTADGMEGKGAIFIDSLTEFFTISEPTSTLETVKNWRVEFCKMMSIPIFATYHIGLKTLDEFAAMIDYLVDGIIDFRFDPLLAQQGLLARQLRVRKMKGAVHDTVWHYFTIERGGLVPMRTQGASEPAHKKSK
ncbi:MAG: RAD55 family ATPase [Candidatus Methanomethyliaceae archaeon]|nr:RAD55 family ATPase [Candidatus Methanomethyliaceae archaeon]